ncbi:MAG: hypothetical protein KGZ39_00285 [Simkania sp.]|nr:hypothetical protein [Simkania sp.]
MSAYLKSYKQNLSEKKANKSPEIEGTSSYFKKMISTPEKEEEFEEEKEGVIGKSVRGAVRTAEDIKDVITGAPGNFLSLIHKGTGKISEAITGQPPQDYEKTWVSELLPTTQQLESRRPEYSKPKTSGEASASEFVQGVTDLLIPIPSSKTARLAGTTVSIIKQIGKKVATATGLEASGESVKDIAKRLGVDEDTANYLKMGTVVIGSLLSQNGLRGAEKYKSSLYKEASSLKPSNATVDARHLHAKALRLQRELEKGGKASTHSYALEKVKEVIEATRKGKGRISVDELEEFSKKINTERGDLYKRFSGDKKGIKTAIAMTEKADDLVKSGLKDYGSTNPKWYNKWQEAQGVHGAIEESKKISRFIERNAKTIGATGIGTIVTEIFTNPGAIVPTSAGALIAFAGTKVGELGARIVKNKSLRKYYLNVLDGAARGDSAFMNHNLNKLSKAIEDDPDLLSD